MTPTSAKLVWVLDLVPGQLMHFSRDVGTCPLGSVLTVINEISFFTEKDIRPGRDAKVQSTKSYPMKALSQ